MIDNELLRIIVEQLPLGVVITDTMGRFLLTSNIMKKMWENVSPDPVDTCIGSSIFNMYTMDDEPYALENIPLYRVIKNQETIKDERMKIKFSDSVRHAQVSASPVYINNNFSYVFLVCEDITEKLRVEEEACTAQVASQFLATISHELRTPMHGILGMLDILSETTMTTQQQEHVGVIQRSTRNLLVILNDILDYSKWKANKVELENRTYTIRSIFNDVFTIHSSVIAHTDATLTLFISDDVPLRNYGDPQRVTQCLNNIIQNALKFVTPNQKNSVHIDVDVSKSQDSDGNMCSNLQITVTDSGIGMSADTLGKLFQPFVQADCSITRVYGGTGLGLSIVKRITEQMNGSISAQSELGKGTTFMLTLPLLEASRKRKRTCGSGDASPMTPPQQYSSNIRILLAEDNPINKLLATTQLTKRGYNVLAVEDGFEVLDILAADQNYDILLLDIQMPKLGGHETCKRLRARGWIKPIIALTASAMESDRARCLAVGMDDYMQKPFKIDNLTDKIEFWLGAKGNIRAP